MPQVDDRKAGVEKKAKDAARKEADKKDEAAKGGSKKRSLSEVGPGIIRRRQNNSTYNDNEIITIYEGILKHRE
jgi:hypothetical protein